MNQPNAISTLSKFETKNPSLTYYSNSYQSTNDNTASNHNIFPARIHGENSEILPEELSGEEGEGHGSFTKHAKSSVFMAAMNIINTIIGAGILNLPYVISQFGILVGSLIIILTYILTNLSCLLLLKSKNLCGHSKYNTIGVTCFGLIGENIIKLIIIINNLGLCIVYLVIFGNVSNKLIAAAGGDTSVFYFQQGFLIMIVAFIIFPFVFTKSMNSLKSLSFMAVTSIVIFCIITIYNFFKTMANGKYDNSTINFFPSSDLSITEAIINIPTVILAFTFQFNFFPIYKSLERVTDKRMELTTLLALSVVLIIYLIVAIFGYMSFGSAVSDQGLINNFTRENLGLPLYIIILVSFLISSTLTFPLMFFGVRENIYSFILGCLTRIQDEHESENREAELNELLVRKTKVQLRKVPYIFFCTFLYASIIVMAIITPSIKTVFNFVGTIAANAISYLLPSLFYLNLCKNERFFKKIALGLFFYGVSVGIICLIASLISIVM